MEKHLQKAQELVTLLTQERSSVREKSKENEAITLKLEKAQVELANRDQDLREREDAVKNIENAQFILGQAKKQSLDNQSEEAKLQKEREDIAVTKKDLREKIDKARQADELITKGNELLKKGLDDLKLAKENYKAEVLENLKKASA